jgi:hypothetical protein
MTTPSNAPGGQSPEHDLGGLITRGHVPGSAEHGPLAKPESKVDHSGWTTVAFGCFFMSLIADAVVFAFLGRRVPGDITGLAGVAILGGVVLISLGLTLLGAACAWLGLRRRPVRRNVAMTALVLNLIPLCLFLAAWIVPPILN